MEKYHITKSILSAFAYQFDCHESVREDAREEFLKALRRERIEPTEAIINGWNFENCCYGCAEGSPIPDEFRKWESGVREIVPLIRGGQFQVSIKKDIEVDGMLFELHGVLDVLKAGVICDIKFKNKSFNSIDVYGDYLECPQHPAYFYLCPEAYEFCYLVSDGDGLYIESYRPEECKPIEYYIRNFIEGIKASGDFETYKKYWRLPLES